MTSWLFTLRVAEAYYATVTLLQKFLDCYTEASETVFPATVPGVIEFFDFRSRVLFSVEFVSLMLERVAAVAYD